MGREKGLFSDQISSDLKKDAPVQCINYKQSNEVLQFIFYSRSTGSVPSFNGTKSKTTRSSYLFAKRYAVISSKNCKKICRTVLFAKQFYLQNSSKDSSSGKPTMHIYCNFFCVAVGKVVLLNDHEVCKKGDVLTPEQARILVGF